jgi:hypothetical protein
VEQPNGAQTSLIVDDNRLPSGGTAVAKLRAVEWHVDAAAPLTLSVDFSPVIEGTCFGRCRMRSRYRAGTDRQFDLTNTSTAQSVLALVDHVCRATRSTRCS